MRKTVVTAAAVLLALVAVFIACDSGQVTAPEPQATPVQSTPTAQATPQPVLPATDETIDMVFVFDDAGTLTVLNNRKDPVSGHICVYEYGKTGFANQKLLGEYPATWVVGESVTQFNPVQFVGKDCGKWIFQLDALRWDRPCPQDPFTLGGTGFFKGRAGIEYQNDTCLPPCVPEWKELPPEITYGEWGECKAQGEGCSQSRTKTTVIKEQNSCTQEIREKSRKTESESKPCECQCVPVWKESFKVTYTEWGACEKQRDGTCAKYRQKITEIWHTNSCTGETKLYKTTTEREFEKCECETTCSVIIPSVSAAIAVLPHVCPEHPYGKPEDECAAFGLDYQGKDDFAQYTSSQDARLAIVKAGTCYTYFENVHIGDLLSVWDGKGISHVTYCKCP